MIGGINPYRTSVGLYPQPVPVPPCDPDFQPVSVSVSCAWIAYICGALKALTMQATWDTEDEDEMSLAIQRANSLIDIFAATMNESECATIPFAQHCNYDLPDSAGGWYVVDDAGTYTPTVGFVGTFYDVGDYSVCSVRKDIDPPIHLQRVIFTAHSTYGGDLPVGQRIRVNVDAENTILESGTLNSGTQNYSWEGDYDNVSNIRIDLNSGSVVTDIELTLIESDSIAPGGSTC